MQLALLILLRLVALVVPFYILIKGRGVAAALGEIEQNAGRLYDSEAVAACIHLFRDKGYALPA